eukprot:TRINITY_DN4596_c0_g1_i1.p1 TRINITY_DN4596_c0_g1~~TRINITY_DN4596_c0_g1_i1.p1  ORF type:complete len:529 (-),score=125.81 TRINITY_DN4596_c0_g1_i1:41-1405(-)
MVPWVLSTLGRLALPILSYTQPFDSNMEKEFAALCGSVTELQQRTASPPFERLLNMAKGIFFAQKTFPNEWRQVRHVIPFSSYFTYVLSGKICSDGTSVGCHTYLWDFVNNKWSHVARALNVEHLLPPIRNSWEVVGTVQPSVAQKTHLREGTLVASGLHDSNASLVPYIALMRGKDFAINSSGTWCVVMHPSDRVELKKEDLGRIIFYNMSVFRKPVRTVNFPGGMEFAAFTAGFKKFSEPPDEVTGKDDSLGPEYRQIIRDARVFLLPGIFGPGTHFLGCRPGFAVVDDKGKVALTAWEDVVSGKTKPPVPFARRSWFAALLRLSLAAQTHRALLCADTSAEAPVFIEGPGLKNDHAYGALLAALRPHATVGTSTGITHATAFGAAMMARWVVLGHAGASADECAAELLSGEVGHLVGVRHYAPYEDPVGLARYAERWAQCAAQMTVLRGKL